MNAKILIIKALKRARKKRTGLRVISPSKHLSEGHINKADHNLIVMTDLDKLEHNDWVVIVAYYAMYHSALAVLSKIGLESKEHATTVAVLEYFFGKHLSKTLLDKFNSLKDKKDNLELVKLEEKYIDYLWKIKTKRETVQYGITTTYKETNEIINNVREFVNEIKVLLEEISEELVSVISKEMGGLKER